MDWTGLAGAVSSCRKCRLCETRRNTVFGEGNPHAELMFVGEGPGADEDAAGRPFVGRAGQLLDKMISAMTFTREEVYIANIVKCRPPKNRDPMNTEQEACLDWLRGQYSCIRPKIVICLGRIAAMALIKPDFRITKEHGLVFDKDGVKFIATYHPSALLRDASKRPDAFMDIKAIEALIKEQYPDAYL